MQNSCCVKGCPNKKTRESKERISFHRFPQIPKLRAQWLEFLGKTDWVPEAVICSEHFDESAIRVKTEGGRRYIRQNTVPMFLDVRDNPRHVEPSKPPRIIKRRMSGDSLASEVIKRPPKRPASATKRDSATQTHVGEWTRTTQLKSHKGIQASMPSFGEKYWYWSGGMQVSEKPLPLYCGSIEQHKQRHRIDMLCNELNRLKNIKKMQDIVIARLRRKQSKMDRDNEFLMQSQSLVEQQLADSMQLAAPSNSGSNLPVIYLENMNIQCVT